MPTLPLISASSFRKILPLNLPFTLPHSVSFYAGLSVCFINGIIFLTLMSWRSKIRRVEYLEKITPLPTTALPSLSVIFVARDEEENVGKCAFSLFKQHYPSLQIIAVNDRSSDGTAPILHNLKSMDPRLSVVNIEELPGGWIGKNHALWKGTTISEGEWILFTDADIKFSPEAIRKAVSCAVKNNLDHLVVFPELESTGLMESATLLCFMMLMNAQARPWNLKDPKTSDALGIGAFNLIRRSTYEAIGTHQEFPLSIVDDLQLGRLVKKMGFRQDGLWGKNQVRVKWQKNLYGILKGLEKNFFAGFGFSRIATWTGILGLLFLSWLPVASLFIPIPAVKTSGGLVLFSVFLFFIRVKKIQRCSLFCYPMLPLGMTFLAAAALHSMRKILKEGGVRWRDTFYPLSLFKKPTLMDVLRILAGRYI